MPGFRFPVSVPQSLGELFERLRELLPQLEAKVLPNRLIGTSETKIAHGLKSTPVFVAPSHPHCIAVVKETRRPDQEFVYLKATNPVVVNVWTLAVGSLGTSMVPDGGYNLPDWDPEGLDDHEVKATSADTGHGPLLNKVKALSGINISETETAGVKQVGIACTVADDHLVKARNDDATTVGGLMDKTTNSTTVTREQITEDGVEKVRFNAVPPTPEPGQGSWLYTGSIQAATLLDPVVAFVKSSDGSTGISSGATSWFDLQVDGVSFQKKTNGQLYGLNPTGGETIVLEVGDRVAFFWEHPTTNKKYNWICTVTTLGDGSTKAVLTKSADVLVHESTFKVDGAGAQFESWYFQLWTDPIPEPALDLVWIYVPDYVNTTTYNLLTSTEVHLAGSVTRETEVTIPGGSSGGVNFEVPLFEMLNGVGLSAVPKGVVKWEVLAYVVTDNPDATTFIRAFLSLDQGILSRFGSADSKAIHSTTPELLQFQGAIPTDIACNPTDKLSAVFYGYSDSATDIKIRLVFNGQNHSTRVQTTVVTASNGTLDHQLLTPKSRGYADSGEEALAAATRHRETDIADNAPACYFISGTTNGLTRTPGTAGTATVAINASSAVVFTSTTPALDPWLDVLPTGNYRVRLRVEKSTTAYVMFDLKVGSVTLAVSDWYPVTGYLCTMTTPAVGDHGVAVDKTLPVTLRIFAKTATGSGTVTIGFGGVSGSALTCPWQDEVSAGRCDLEFPCNGRMEIDEVFAFLTAARAIVILSSGGRAVAVESVAATTSTTVSIYHMTEAGVSTLIGHVTMGVGARFAAVDITNPVLMDVGETIYCKAPSLPDNALMGLSIILPGVLVKP